MSIDKIQDKYRFSLEDRIRCPECNAQEEEHCTTCEGKGYPTVGELIELVASQAEARGRESVVDELSITIDKWQNNNNRTDEFECGGYDSLVSVKRLLTKLKENK